MCEILFIFNGIQMGMQFMNDEKMNSIFQKYCSKVRKDINSLFFLYNGRKIDEDLNINELINSIDKKARKMNILVYDKNNINKLQNEGIIKSKLIICPKCNEICLIEIKDYKILLYGCKNKHQNDIILLNEFENTQKIDESKIICNNCNNNKYNSYNKQFFKCLSCGYNLCPLCNSNHNDSHEIINYDDINYICNTHNEIFISYCDICKINLCMICQKNHNKEHNIQNFAYILENKNEIIEELNVFKTKIDRFNDIIKEIIEILNNIMNNINIFYTINYDIIKNYKKQNKNYEILRNISEIKNNIKLNDIDEIINEKNIIDQIEKIINISNKMKNKTIEENLNKTKIFNIEENNLEKEKKELI